MTPAPSHPRPAAASAPPVVRLERNRVITPSATGHFLSRSREQLEQLVRDGQLTKGWWRGRWGITEASLRAYTRHTRPTGHLEALDEFELHSTSPVLDPGGPPRCRLVALPAGPAIPPGSVLIGPAAGAAVLAAAAELPATIGVTAGLTRAHHGPRDAEMVIQGAVRGAALQLPADVPLAAAAEALRLIGIVVV